MSARILLALRASSLSPRIATPVLSNRLAPLSGFAPRFYSSETGDLVTVFSRLRKDVKDAMRAKDKTRTSVLKSILSDITYAEKTSNAGATLTADSEVAPLIQNAIAKRRDSATQYRSGGREDLAATEEGEIVILESYLPKQMSEEEIEEAARKVCQAVGAQSLRDMGKVLKELKLDPARAHKQAISAVVKKVLTEAGKA